jgi:hypothetical protein
VTAPPTVLPRVVAAAANQRRIERRRRTRTTIAMGLAAALVAVLVGIGVHLAETTAAPAPSTLIYSAMHKSSPNVSVEAEIALTPTDAGTSVTMRCRYPDEHRGRSWPVWLVVFPQDSNQAEPLGVGWPRRSGSHADRASVHYSPRQITASSPGSNQATCSGGSP